MLAAMMADMTTSKTLFLMAIVLGCFAVLWPKIFYPMMFEGPERLPKSDPFQRSGPEFNHPAFRHGKGRPIFPSDDGRTLRRTIDKDLKPGPIPGMRPSMGGPGIQPQSQRSQGPMGVLMPLYTVGIVCFFVYTVMKIIFKKRDESESLVENHQNIQDPYSNLAEQYFKTKPVDQHSNKLNEQILPKVVEQSYEQTKDSERSESSNQDSSIGNPDSSDNVVNPCDKILANLEHPKADESNKRLSSVQEETGEEDTLSSQTNPDDQGKDTQISEMNDSTMSTSVDSTHPTLEEDYLNQLMEKLKGSDDNLKQLLTYLKKIDPNFKCSFDGTGMVFNFELEETNNRHIMKDRLETNISASNGKVTPVTEDKKSSEISSGNHTMSKSPSKDKSCNKSHTKFSDRMKNVFRKSKTKNPVKK